MYEDTTATILYVDDEELARKYFVRIASTEYNVLALASADEAINILRSEGQRVGVLVTDYRMPGRDGGDLLSQIELEYPHVVRILVTAYADKDLLLKTVNTSEVFRILEKPLDVVEVRNILRMAIELSYNRINRKQKLLAVNEALAFLAHELNTPLASIVNFAHGIETRLEQENSASGQVISSEDIGTAAHSITNNARYCLTMLSAFADSMQDARLTFTGNHTSTASQLLTSLMDTYPLTPDQRNWIQIKVEEDFTITALPNCISLVLTSLMSNALRALYQHPAPSLRFSVMVNAQAQICIQDNGPGIEPEILERIFVDPVTTYSHAGGSGRGLLFCHRIMQSFGGNLIIQSEPGKSTAVTLFFPSDKRRVTKISSNESLGTQPATPNTVAKINSSLAFDNLLQSDLKRSNE